jgi:hypothetical protein
MIIQAKLPVLENALLLRITFQVLQLPSFTSDCFPNELGYFPQVRAGVDALEWKILLFLSFQIFQRVNPGSSSQMWARIGIFKG